MKIVNLATGKIEEHEDSYAVRLIEQGRAVLPSPATEKPTSRKPRKTDDVPAPAPDKE